MFWAIPRNGNNPSHVQFEALKEDVFYYIFVQGEKGATEITFNLAVQAESTVPAPLNEECDSTLGATSPFKLSNGVTRLGTTVGTMLAESDEDQVAPNSPCPEGEVAVDTGGVWYEFTGTGTPVEISVCGMADFDTKLSVHCAPHQCDTLAICVASENSAISSPDCGFTSKVEVNTCTGETYKVLVHGNAVEMVTPSPTGSFVDGQFIRNAKPSTGNFKISLTTK